VDSNSGACKIQQENSLLAGGGLFQGLRVFHNRVYCLGKLIGFLRADEQFLTVFEDELDAFVAAHIVGPANSFAKAVPDAPAAVLPDWFVSAGIAFAQIFARNFSVANMKGKQADTIAMNATTPPSAEMTKAVASVDSCMVDATMQITMPAPTEQTNTQQSHELNFCFS
jgi:hypothetical protein